MIVTLADLWIWRFDGYENQVEFILECVGIRLAFNQIALFVFCANFKCFSRQAHALFPHTHVCCFLFQCHLTQLRAPFLRIVPLV